LAETKYCAVSLDAIKHKGIYFVLFVPGIMSFHVDVIEILLFFYLVELHLFYYC